MDKVKIIKEDDDPLALRISMGGLPGVGYYVVYRGDLEDIKECFETIWGKFENLKEESCKNGFFV